MLRTPRTQNRLLLLGACEAIQCTWRAQMWSRRIVRFKLQGHNPPFTGGQEVERWAYRPPQETHGQDVAVVVKLGR